MNVFKFLEIYHLKNLANQTTLRLNFKRKYKGKFQIFILNYISFYSLFSELLKYMIDLLKVIIMFNVHMPSKFVLSINELNIERSIYPSETNDKEVNWSFNTNFH